MHLQTVEEKNRFNNNYKGGENVIVYLGFNINTFLNSYI